MHRRSLLSLAIFSLAVLGVSTPAHAASEPAYRLSGPFTHDNLAIYLIHGRSTEGPVPLTLQEAIARDAIRVHETSSVNELEIENLGDQEVFVQSGDIVKGGKQDRVLMVSLLVPPHSGRMQIASFCVEQGRWSARGREDVSRFSSADAAVPSREAKLAMRAPMASKPDATGSSGSARRRSETGERQQEVWRSVASAQRKLSRSVGAPVQSAQSQSSLQLSIENDKVQARVAAYVDALIAEGQRADDVVGYVFAINGRLNSADLYPSNALFRKMWAKLLKASATEAVGEQSETAAALPSTEAVLAFLQSAEGGKPQARELTKTVRLETRESDQALYFATERAGGGWVHRNYLAR